MDFTIIEQRDLRIGNTFIVVHYEPTVQEIRKLRTAGVHSNHFHMQPVKGVLDTAIIERNIRNYYDRKLKAADEGRPYPQHHRTTLNLAVAANADDALEVDDDTQFTSSQNLGLGANVRVRSNSASNLRVNCGFRFAGATIRPGSTINTCVFQARAISTTVDDVLCTISFNDVDNAANFTTEADVHNRACTTATVAWNQTALGTSYVSAPDLAVPCQEVIDRAGWANNNALMVILDGDNSATARICDIENFENTGTSPALLDIDFTGPPTAVKDIIGSGIIPWAR